MKILSVKSLEIEAIKVIRFARFCDHRGYFTEHYRKSDFQTNVSGVDLGGREKGGSSATAEISGNPENRKTKSKSKKSPEKKLWLPVRIP